MLNNKKGRLIVLTSFIASASAILAIKAYRRKTITDDSKVAYNSGKIEQLDEVFCKDKLVNKISDSSLKNRELKQRTIWILNHYATGMFINQNGRHHILAKYLAANGYTVTIVCASTVHNSDLNLIRESGSKYRQDSKDGISYVFIKCRNYQGNGRDRMLNMLDYYHGVLDFCKKQSKPDVIIGSSVHPLACLAAIQLAKRYKCKNIIEIRDLWPLSLEAYGVIPKGGIIAHALYRLERYLYENANSIIFTMQGGAQYIQEKGWTRKHGGGIDLEKVYYICNGVDLPLFDSNLRNHPFDCDAFHIDDAPIIMYTGSIRRVNDLSRLVDVADEMKNENVRFVVFGSGDDLENLNRRVSEKGLRNIHFLGRIEKRQVPSALAHADIAICLGSPKGTDVLSEYGNSNNKLFEYLASGKPLLYCFKSNPPIIQEFDCGIEERLNRPDEIAQAIRLMLSNPERLEEWGNNARVAAQEYSYERLAQRLMLVIEKTIEEAT